MPWFYFDLVINEKAHHQGGMILENDGARDRADRLAEELHVAKPELIGQRCFVRVVDEANEEIYRTPLESVPKWSMLTIQK